MKPSVSWLIHKCLPFCLIQDDKGSHTFPNITSRYTKANEAKELRSKLVSRTGNKENPGDQESCSVVKSLFDHDGNS